MTHSPPIPAGNQSPYPIQEPPHRHVATPPVEPHDEGSAIATSTMIGAAVVAGTGAAAAAAAYFLSVRKAPASKRKPRRRKPARD